MRKELKGSGTRPDCPQPTDSSNEFSLLRERSRFRGSTGRIPVVTGGMRGCGQTGTAASPSATPSASRCRTRRGACATSGALRAARPRGTGRAGGTIATFAQDAFGAGHQGNLRVRGSNQSGDCPIADR